MSQTVKQSDVYQDLLDLPENIIGEIIKGELHTQPRPAPRHALASSSLGGELDGPYFKGRGGPGGWWIIDEPEIHSYCQTVPGYTASFVYEFLSYCDKKLRPKYWGYWETFAMEGIGI